MKIIFKFLYDYGFYTFLIFSSIWLFIIGTLINRHYIGFAIHEDTYYPELLQVDSVYYKRTGTGGSFGFASGLIENKTVSYKMRYRLKVGDSIPVWYSPKSCSAINVLTRKEGEPFMAVKKGIVYRFIRLFLMLNMPLILSLYYYRKFKKDEKTNQS